MNSALLKPHPQDRRQQERPQRTRKLQLSVEHIVGDHGHLRGQQEREQQDHHPKPAPGDFKPGQAVADHRADDHLRQHREKRDDEIFKQGGPIIHGHDRVVIVFQVDGGWNPLHSGIQQILTRHQGGREHIQHRIKEDKRNARQQHIHEEIQKQAALFVGADENLSPVLLPGFQRDSPVVISHCTTPP